MEIKYYSKFYKTRLAVNSGMTTDLRNSVGFETHSVNSKTYTYLYIYIVDNRIFVIVLRSWSIYTWVDPKFSGLTL